MTELARSPIDLRYAYNTNGLTSHRLSDALPLLADSGYAGVALTLDVVHLDPFASDALAQAEKVRARCDELGLGVVVETGARYLLDRGDPLVAVGADPGGWARVHLTADAQARLGGPAWFDRAGADRRVGPLYALYREPGRHTVAEVLAR